MVEEEKEEDSESEAVYDEILAKIKKTLITFITQLDIREVYQFVNFFPFLIDPDELHKIELMEQEEKEQYRL